MSAPSSAAPGTRYRFIVSSAEEAVALIQKEFGGQAKVVSVKQVTGSGLARLLSAPKLEIIAEVTGPANAPAPAPAPIASTAPVAPPGPAIAAPVSSSVEEEIEQAARGESEPLPSSFEEPLERMLVRAGLTPRMMAHLQANERWPRIIQRPLREALLEVCTLLRSYWQSTVPHPVGQRVAFFGSPGSGITTALCKALTMDVFFRRQPARVLKLDGDQPNPTEGLAMFCETLNVPLLRSSDGLDDVPPTERVYFDVPGAPISDPGRWKLIGRLLDEFYADTRVLVINAAYDTSIIKRMINHARIAGATHLAFTHLDEVQHWGKLWEFMFGDTPKPLFFGFGQNVSGNLSDNVFSMLLEKSFPITKPASH